MEMNKEVNVGMTIKNIEIKKITFKRSCFKMWNFFFNVKSN